MHTPDLKVAKMSATKGSASVLGHTSGSTTTSVPCSSWAAELVDPRKLQQHHGMVVVEKILSRASPKHHTRETRSTSKGRKMPTKRACERAPFRGVRAPLYIGGGEASCPKGSTPQEVPPPLPSSCGWSSHSPPLKPHNVSGLSTQKPRVFH